MTTTLWWITVSSGWLCTSLALIIATGSGALVPLALAILALTIATRLLQPQWSPTVAVAGAAIYAGLCLWLLRDSGKPAEAPAALTAFAGTYWLSGIVLTRIRDMHRMMGLLRQRVLELSTWAETNGVLTPEAGRIRLTEELDRCL